MKHALKILISASFIYNFAAGMLGPIYAIFVMNIGGNILDAGIAWAIYAFAIGIATFIFSRYEDNMSKEKIIVAGYGLIAVGFFAYYFVDTIIQLFIVEMFFGVITAFHDPAWEAFFSEKITRKKSAAEWGNWEAGKYIAIGAAALIGSYVATGYGFKTLFIIMGGVAAISAIVSYMLLKKKS
ncbi:MAG: MFS transporter [Nanoarchaeota archaeon]|nr:MFS transporter [Nanoarchaeota archaeon]